MNNISLPDHWKVARLGDVCNIVMGQSPPSTTYNDEGVGMPFLQGKAEFTELFPVPTKYCTKQLRVCSTESVLMSVRAPVGNVNLADREYIIGRGLTSIRLKHGNNRFLFYLLLHSKKEFEAKSSGSTFKSINKTTINNFRISLPPLPEQCAIAHVLQTIQEAKFTRQREIALEFERKAALMDYLFSHGTKGEPRKPTEIGEIPESWQVTKLGDLVKLKSGSSRPKDIESQPNTELTVPVYGGNGILGYTSKKFSEERLLVIGRVGAYCGCVHIAEAPNWITDNALYPEKWFSSEVSLDFLAEQLKHCNLNRLQRRGGQPLVTQSILHQFKIPLPSFSEQRAIASVFQALDKKIKTLEQEVEHLGELFHAMLDELITGQQSAVPLIDALK